MCAPCAAAFLFALMPVHVILTESSLRIDNKIPDAHEHYVDLVEQRAQKAEQEVEKMRERRLAERLAEEMAEARQSRDGMGDGMTGVAVREKTQEPSQAGNL